MRPAALILAATTILLGACGNDQRAAAPAAVPSGPTQAPAAVTPAPAAEPILALGLTRRQLEDADLLDPAGADIGEVESVITDPAGTVTGLLVEIEDSNPDRYVTVPLTGLALVERGDDRDLRGALTRDALLALPETRR